MPKNDRKTSRKREIPVREWFRENLKARRLELDYSQKDLGKLLNTSQAFIQKLENKHHEKTPSLHLLYDIARVLKTQPSDLLVPGRFSLGIEGETDLRTIVKSVKGMPTIKKDNTVVS